MILVLLENDFERIHNASVTGMFCSFNFFLLAGCLREKIKAALEFKLISVQALMVENSVGQLRCEKTQIEASGDMAWT